MSLVAACQSCVLCCTACPVLFTIAYICGWTAWINYSAAVCGCARTRRPVLHVALLGYNHESVRSCSHEQLATDFLLFSSMYAKPVNVHRRLPLPVFQGHILHPISPAPQSYFLAGAKEPASVVPSFPAVISVVT